LSAELAVEATLFLVISCREPVLKADGKVLCDCAGQMRGVYVGP
jgi:hypothetical protein